MSKVRRQGEQGEQVDMRSIAMHMHKSHKVDMYGDRYPCIDQVPDDQDICLYNSQHSLNSQNYLLNEFHQHFPEQETESTRPKTSGYVCVALSLTSKQRVRYDV